MAHFYQTKIELLLLLELKLMLRQRQKVSQKLLL